MKNEFQAFFHSNPSRKVRRFESLLLFSKIVVFRDRVKKFRVLQLLHAECTEVNMPGTFGLRDRSSLLPVLLLLLLSCLCLVSPISAQAFQAFQQQPPAPG